MSARLPNELLDVVCSFVTTHKDLYNLCLTSKALCAFSRPLLYRHICLRAMTSRGKLPDFTKTLLRNPQLAKLIMKMDLLESDWSDVGGAEAWYDLHDFLDLLPRREALDIWIQSHPRGPPFSYGGTRDNSVLDAWLELLIISVPNLNRLKLVGSHYFAAPWGQLASRYGHQKILENVDTVEIEHTDTEGGISLVWISSFLAMLQPTQLLIGPCIGFLDDETIKLSRLRRLQLWQSCLAAEDCNILAKSCPNLEVLAFLVADAVVSQYGSGDDVTPQEFARAIEPLHQKLRVLYFDTSETDYFGETPSPIESLLVFERLEVLLISIEAITSFQGSGWKPFLHKLPRSLRTLFLIYTNNQSMDQSLKELARIASTDLPHLEIIHLHNGTTASEIRESCARAGISYQGDAGYWNWQFIDE